MRTEPQPEFHEVPEIAELSLSLSNRVMLGRLGRLIVGLEDLYGAHCELSDLCKETETAAGIRSGRFKERLIRELEVVSLQIGTPNHLRMRGRGKELLAIVGLMTAVLGIPVAGTEAFKNFAEAEAHEIDAKSKRLEFAIRAREALNAGQITQQEYDTLTERAERSRNEIISAVFDRLTGAGEQTYYRAASHSDAKSR